MSIDDLYEAYVRNENPIIPPEQREEFDQLVAMHQEAMGGLDTTRPSVATAKERPAPALPEDYQIQGVIGQGGAGVVYLAHHRTLDRPVAVKVLRSGELTADETLRRFLKEGKRLARLRHPNIVRVLDAGQAGGEPYLVMEHIQGRSLKDLLETGPLAPRDSVVLLLQFAEGVAYAHSEGILHRDLKPSNILLDGNDHPYVTDFGCARDLQPAADATETTGILGTPAYMAPEQAAEERDKIGKATDVYALGVILYQMLTGKLPHGEDAKAKVLSRLLHDDPASPRELDPTIPPDLEAICLKAMAKTPEDRYATMEAFIADLRAFKSGKTIVARRPGFWRHARRTLRKHRRKLTVVAAVIIFVAVAASGAQFFVLPRYHAHVAKEQAAEADRQDRQAVRDAIAEAVMYDQRKMFDEESRSYYRVYSRANAGEGKALLEDMIHAADMIPDLPKAVSAWQRVLSIAPDKTFGPHDFQVAQSLLCDLLAGHTRLEEAVGAEADKATRLEARIKMIQDWSLATAQDRKEMEGVLDVLTSQLHPAMPDFETGELNGWVQVSCKAGGGAGDILTPCGAWLDPAVALLDEADKLEREQKADAALAVAEKAFQQVVSGFPIYSYPQFTGDDTHGAGEQWWTEKSPDCDVVKRACKTLRRLKPGTKDLLSGGVMIRLEGVKPSRDWVGMVALDLWAEGTADEHHQVLVSIGADGEAKVGVARGKYHATAMVGGYTGATPEAAAEGTFLEMELGKPPDEVEVGDDWKDLVTLRLRRLPQMTGLAPAEKAEVDPRSEVFRWKAVPGAAKYMLSLDVSVPEGDPGSGQTKTGRIRVEHTGLDLCLGKAAKEALGPDANTLVKNRAAGWWVDAFDAAGNRIATSGPPRPLTLAHGLDEK